jgi:hypothetical protein
MALASGATKCVGSLHFTYGEFGYTTEHVANVFVSRNGLSCLAIESRASKYNEQYLCQVISVDFEQGSCNKVLAISIQVFGDGSLGVVQLPNSSRLELLSNHKVSLKVVRVLIEAQSANHICGTLFYMLPDALWYISIPNDSSLPAHDAPNSKVCGYPTPINHLARKGSVRKQQLRLEGVHFANESSVIGTGGLALSERLIGANEGLRGRITFSGSDTPPLQSLSKPRDDRLLEVLLEQNDNERVNVPESTHIYDLECVKCCKEVGMCVCETKPCAIGVGAQGSVWKYRRSSDKTFVAIKKVSSRSRFDASWRMSGEAAVMSLFAKNGSQHVIPFYGSFVDCDGFINLSMKYLGKGSLADLLSSHHRLLTPAVSILGLHLLSALDYFHNDLNLLHRDIKPSNIMIEDDGRFVLADLALAILTSAGSPADNSLAGTIHYMSPECLIDGVASPASDLWSFGMVLLEALLGYSPLDKVASVVSGGSTSATESDFVSESTMEYWRQHHIITNVKSPIYLPSVRQELDALSRAFGVNVLDFFDRCLHPVRAQALHFLSP